MNINTKQTTTVGDLAVSVEEGDGKMIVNVSSCTVDGTTAEHASILRNLARFFWKSANVLEVKTEDVPEAPAPKYHSIGGFSTPERDKIVDRMFDTCAPLLARFQKRTAYQIYKNAFPNSPDLIRAEVVSLSASFRNECRARWRAAQLGELCLVINGEAGKTDTYAFARKEGKELKW